MSELLQESFRVDVRKNFLRVDGPSGAQEQRPEKRPHRTQLSPHSKLPFLSHSGPCPGTPKGTVCLGLL